MNLLQPRRRELTSMDSLWRYVRLFFTIIPFLLPGGTMGPQCGIHSWVEAERAASSNACHVYQSCDARNKSKSFFFVEKMTKFKNSCRTSRKYETSTIARYTRLAKEGLPTFGLLVLGPRASHPSGFSRVSVFFYKYRRPTALLSCRKTWVAIFMICVFRILIKDA